MSEQKLVTLIRRISRLFYDDLTQIIIDYLVKHKSLEDNHFALEYNLKANDVRGALHKLKDDGFVARKEINKNEVDEQIRKQVTKNTTFCHWTFDTDIMNVIKYMVMKLKQRIDKKIQNANEDTFDCPNCKRSFPQMEVYTRNFKCPFDDTDLKKKKKECANPEKLRKESNKIFSSFEASIKELDDFAIPREFFGFKAMKKPIFNTQDAVSMQGYKIQFSNFKEAPTVHMEFDSLKSDVYKDLDSFNEKAVKEAQNTDPELFKFYCEKTKDRLVQTVKSIGKKLNKRKRKENYKKMLESSEYEETYKKQASKLIDF